MPRRDLSFEITSKVDVHADFEKQRVVISFKTKDGKLIHLEGDYQVLEKIHEKVREQLEEP